MLVTFLFISLQNSSWAIPDPSAVRCANFGGFYDLYQGKEWGIGVCEIEGGLIGSWTFVREMGHSRTLAANKFLNKKEKTLFENLKGNNQDQIYCSSIAGILTTFKSYRGVDTSFCLFEDGSFIGLKTLLGGSDKYPKLAYYLRKH